MPAMFALVGVVVHYALWRYEVLPSGIVQYAVGVALIMLAVGLFVWARWSFRRHGESLAVHVRTRRIVQDGAYAWGRNPVYLSFVLGILGLGCLLNAVAVMLAAVLAFGWLNWYVIPREESYLRAKLGTEYGEYTGRTRRWV